MGLSRNKVSLRERGDGSPPFYGESVIGYTLYNVVHKPKSSWLSKLIYIDSHLFSFERLASLKSCSLKTEYFKHDLSVQVAIS